MKPLSGGETEVGQCKDGETLWCKQVPGLQEEKKRREEEKKKEEEEKNTNAMVEIKS